MVTRILPEHCAYWYFRLNGFPQIENFVVHPGRRGSASICPMPMRRRPKFHRRHRRANIGRGAASPNG
jgi:hypothetical protein